MRADDLNMAAVILAGGIGARFWPLSTAEKPKQFLELFGDRSLIRITYDRISGLVPDERIVVVTSDAFVDRVREQLPELPEANVIGEPRRRDTAAAACLGALLCRNRFDDPVIATLTADHMIEPEGIFHQTLESAARHARRDGRLYTIGIPPDHPATGYGYLEVGEEVLNDDGVRHFELVRFKEKPDLTTARECIASGRCLWNSGMFVWTAEAILAEAAVHLPALYRALSEAAALDRTPRWKAALKKAFESIEPVSIDYGVMEKAVAVRCVAAEFAWTDVGGWTALDGYFPADETGNRGRGRVLARDASGNLVFCEDSGDTVMMVGVDDLIVVRSGDKTLIVHKDRTEEVKSLVEAMDRDD
ncbi:MAG: sugar phosphate nucleotidyltransferase [Pseudomonadota bacterium]